MLLTVKEMKMPQSGNQTWFQKQWRVKASLFHWAVYHHMHCELKQMWKRLDSLVTYNNGDHGKTSLM